MLCTLLQASAYLERKEDLRALPRIALRRIEHLYYKNDVVYDAMRRHVIAKQVRGCMPSVGADVRRTAQTYPTNGQGAKCQPAAVPVQAV